MTIEEIQKRRDALRDQVASLIADFDRDTGMTVNEILLHRIRVATFAHDSAAYLRNVEVEVILP